MLIGGVLGSLVGGVLSVSARERRILLVAGVAAGISAVFRTPLGAALLAVEVLYRDGFESEGWELSDKEVADDGAWTAAWIKDERTVRLNFGRMQLNSKRATMELAQCPPLVPGHCGPGHLYPMPTPNRR